MAKIKRHQKEIVVLYRLHPTPYNYIFAYTSSDDAFVREASKNKKIVSFLKIRKVLLKDLKIEDNSGMHFNDLNSKPVAMHIRHCSRKDLLGTLVHELNHLVFFLSKYCSFTNEPEFQAYMQMNLFDEFLEIIWQK